MFIQSQRVDKLPFEYYLGVECHIHDLCKIYVLIVLALIRFSHIDAKWVIY